MNRLLTHNLSWILDNPSRLTTRSCALVGSHESSDIYSIRTIGSAQIHSRHFDLSTWLLRGGVK